MKNSYISADSVSPGRPGWLPGASERWLRSVTGTMMWASLAVALLVGSFITEIAPENVGPWRIGLVSGAVLLALTNWVVLPRVRDSRLQLWTEFNIIPALALTVVLLQLTEATELVLLSVVLVLIYTGYFFRLPALTATIFAVFMIAGSALLTEPASLAPHLPSFLAIYLPMAATLTVLLHLHSNETLDALDGARFRALSDPVTGLCNLRALEHGAERELARQHAGAADTLGLVLLNLDNFNSANARYGQLGGDHVLREVAAQLIRVAPRNSVIARIGGDEFAVLLRCDSEELVREHGDLLRAAVRAANSVLDMPGVEIDAAIGCASLPRDGDDLNDLLDAADRAMYAAKGAKRHIVPNLEATPQVDHSDPPEWLEQSTIPVVRPRRNALTLDQVLGGNHRFFGRFSLYTRMSSAGWVITGPAVALSLVLPGHPETTFFTWWMALLIGALLAVGAFVIDVQARSSEHLTFDFNALIGIGVLTALTGGTASGIPLLLVLLVASQAWFWHTDQLAMRLIGPVLIALSPLAYQSIYDAPQQSITVITMVALAMLLVVLTLSMYFDRTLRVQLEERAEELALIDPLTEIPNRRAFDTYVEQLLDPATPTDRFAIVMLDLDGFRKVNTARGRGAGDTVLRAVAAELDAGTRRNDMIARIGGDEFAAVLTGVGIDASRSLAERFVERIANTPEALDAGITASAGFALFPAHGQTLDQLVFTADGALMTVKAGGAGGSRVARVVSAVK